jgi:uncharacterized membrane protein YfhO
MSAGERERSGLRTAAVVAVVIVVIVTAFWAPALFHGKTHFVGDAIGHSLPLMDLHAQALNGSAHLLWSEQIFGGHPLFAEGQGAFAQPLNMLFAWLVPPLYGASLFHYVGMLLAAGAAFGLCRSLGASTGAAGFGAVVALFSGATLGVHHNMTIGGTAIWLPWIFWGMEAWFKQPTVPRAVLWCIACCLCLLAGYPHLFHGAVIYMAFSLLPRFCFASERVRLLQWRRYLSTGVLAVILCMGITAVQLLPLFELVGESHRSAGTSMLPVAGSVELLRGLLFSGVQDPQQTAALVPFVGSLLMSFAILLALVVPTSASVKGHIVATLVLLQLGMGSASPLFAFVYEHNLVPGVKYFRWSWPYLVVMTTGMAVLAAAGIDGLVAVLRNGLQGSGRIRIVAIAVLIGVVAAMAFRVYQPAVSWWSPLFAIAALVLVAMLALAGRHSWLPMTLFLLLTVEVSLQHAHDFQFGDVALLAPPESGIRMAAQDDMRLYRTYYLPGTLLLYALVDARTPDLPALTSAARSMYSGLTSLMHDMPTLSGALALPLRRRALLEPQITREINGATDVAAPGLRVIDLLSLRYVASETVPELPGFEVSFQDARSHWWFLKNNAAKPRIQTYTRTHAVNTAEDALKALTGLAQDELVIEVPEGASPMGGDDAANRPSAIRWRLRAASAIHYVIDVDADRDGWLFLADANYPGWQASVDGNSAKVFSAQVLGKAVAVTAGHHTVEFDFQSASFLHGRMITLASLLAALVFVVCARWRAGLFKSIQS